MNCVELMPETATEFWPDLEPFVIEALKHDYQRTTTADDVRQQIEAGYARILLCTDGVKVHSATVIQCYVDHQGRRTLHVIATAGDDMVDWLGVLIDELVRLARLQECDGGVTMTGRKGWARKLSGYGFRTEQVALRLEVEHGRNEQVEEQAAQQQRANVGERSAAVH